MANKSFIVQYMIKLRDQFGPAADRIRRSANKMRMSLDKAKESFKGLAVTARRQGAILTAAATVPILLLARSMVNAARDAEETRAKFKTVFKNIGVQAEKTADNLAENFGLAGSKARELLGNTGDLLTGFGFTQTAALGLSTKVNELAVDLASFTNFSGGAEGASKAITSALFGEREALKSLGVAISEKQVKAKIALMAAKGEKFASLQQAKAHATLALAVEQSKNAIGDYSRTSEGLANQQRLTSSRIVELKESFGKELLPMALKLTKAIRFLAESLTELSPATKKVLIVIAGVLAVAGPLLLIFGAISLAMPLLTAGFAVFGVVAAAAFSPIGLIILAIAAGAALIIYNWEKVAAFFSGFSKSFGEGLGGTLGELADKFIETAQIISDWFGPNSDATKDVTAFAHLGELVYEFLGGALDFIIKLIMIAGDHLGQLIAAIVTMDFSHFNIDRLKEFLSTTEKPPAKIDQGAEISISGQIGVADGAEVRKPIIAKQTGPRPDNVGSNLAGEAA